MQHKKLYIVKIDSYAGDSTSRNQETYDDDDNVLTEWESTKVLYAVLSVDHKHGAHIIDDGYRTLDEARKAWPEAIAPEEEVAA